MGRKSKYPERNKVLKQLAQLKGEELEKFKEQILLIEKSIFTDRQLIAHRIAKEQWDKRTDEGKKEHIKLMKSAIVKKYNIAALKKIAILYKTRHEWKSKDASSFMIAKRDGFLEECSKLMPNNGYQSKDHYCNFCKKKHYYGPYKQFHGENCKSNPNTKRTVTDDDILKIAKLYKKKKDFRINNYNVYNEAYKRGLMNKACSHMKNNKNEN